MVIHTPSKPSKVGQLTLSSPTVIAAAIKILRLLQRPTKVRTIIMTLRWQWKHTTKTRAKPEMDPKHARIISCSKRIPTSTLCTMRMRTSESSWHLFMLQQSTNAKLCTQTCCRGSWSISTTSKDIQGFGESMLS